MKNKLFGTLLTSLLLVTSLGSSVSAYEVPDTTRTGSIEIELADTEWSVPKNDVEFVVTKVGVEQGGQWFLNSRFADTKIDLNQIETTKELDEAAKTLVNFIANEHVSPAPKPAPLPEMTPDSQENNNQTQENVEEMPEIPLIDIEEMQVGKTDERGVVSFKDLSVGVYLLYVSDEASYDHIDPVLISVPTFNENTKEMDYDIVVSPKHYPVLKSFKINKVDAETGNKPQGGAVFLGTEFTVYNHKGEVSEVLVTDENGYAISKELYPVNSPVKVVETKAPEGYELNEEPLEFIVGVKDEHNVFDFEDLVRKLDINVRKVSDKKMALKGAIFNVYLTDINDPENRAKDKLLGTYVSGGIYVKDMPNTKVLVATNKEFADAKEYTTDENGILTILDLNDGEYYVKVGNSDAYKKHFVENGKFKIDFVTYGETIRLEEIKAPEGFYCTEKDKNVFIKVTNEPEKNIVEFDRVNNKIIIIDTGMGTIELKMTPAEIGMCVAGGATVVIAGALIIIKVMKNRKTEKTEK